MRHNPILEKLKAGEEVTYRPRGNSMVPLIHSGEQVTLEPLTDQHILQKGSIVHVQVAGALYLHLIHAVSDERYQIGNNHGHINGWVPRTKIYGVLKPT